MPIVRELKRRNVFRMAVLYIVAAWLIMQVTEVLITLAHLPHWTGPAIIWLLAIGFPISLIFSWFYEITAEGISLEKDADPEQSITHVTGRRLDFIIISMLCAAVILFAYDKWWIGGPPDKSIAVLPFKNISSDPEQEYFSDGISEELLNLLAKIPKLTVISSSSSFSFKGQDLGIPEIARRLNVAHVLEGSVRKVGNRVRVTAQLIEGRTDKHLWSDTYDRELVDIFAIQNEISEQIVRALKIALGAGEKEAVIHAQKPTENLAAYELYLRGRYFWQRRGEDNIRHAIDLLEQATMLDPQFARAWSSLAAAHVTLPAYSDAPTVEQQPLGMSAAQKALMLDDSLAEAHAVLGGTAFMNREWAEGEAHYLRAITSEPKNSTAHLWYGTRLVAIGRVRDALEETLIAYQLDPLNPGTNFELGLIYFLLSDYRNAIKYIEIARDLGHPYGLFPSTLAQLHLGQFDRAIELAEQFDDVMNFPVSITKLFVEAEIDAGKRPLFLEMLAKHETILPFWVSVPGYASFGQIDDAYRLVNLSLLRDSADPGGSWGVLWFPDIAAFRQDPRFIELVTELGLMDYWREHGWPDACQPAGDSLNCE